MCITSDNQRSRKQREGRNYPLFLGVEQLDEIIFTLNIEIIFHLFIILTMTLVMINYLLGCSMNNSEIVGNIIAETKNTMVFVNRQEPNKSVFILSNNQNKEVLAYDWTDPEEYGLRGKLLPKFIKLDIDDYLESDLALYNDGIFRNANLYITERLYPLYDLAELNIDDQYLFKMLIHYQQNVKPFVNPFDGYQRHFDALVHIEHEGLRDFISNYMLALINFQSSIYIDMRLKNIMKDKDNNLVLNSIFKFRAIKRRSR